MNKLTTLTLVIIAAALFISGCQSTIVGTWDSVQIEYPQPPDEPAVDSLRLVLTPHKDAFLILHFEDSTGETWHSSYRTDGNLFYEHFLLEPGIYQYRIEKEHLIMERDKERYVFEAVK